MLEEQFDQQEEVRRVRAEGGKAANRTPRSFLFHDLEWKRIAAFTDEHGMAAEFVWFATLAAIAGGSGADSDPESREGPVQLMEATFRVSDMLATKLRSEMLTASRDEEPTALITASLEAGRRCC